MLCGAAPVPVELENRGRNAGEDVSGVRGLHAYQVLFIFASYTVLARYSTELLGDLEFFELNPFCYRL
jgi:hypothetical protein